MFSKEISKGAKFSWAIRPRSVGGELPKKNSTQNLPSVGVRGRGDMISQKGVLGSGNHKPVLHFKN